MSLLVTFGALAAFFAAVVALLQWSYKADRDFTDFAVAGRSFGGFAQAMAFLNTFMPGYMFLGAFGFAATAGVLGLGFFLTTVLAPVVMYLLADRVWTWGARHDLRTQPDLMALRYDSRAVRVVAALLGVFALFPWMVLGMQSLGAVFYALSFGSLSFTTAVVLGVVVMSLRQVWTIRMGMRGIVISDVFQGIVAYFLGGALIVWLIVWLVDGGASLAALPAEKFRLPDLSGDAPLLFFSLIGMQLAAALCWPDLFVRLYTGSGVDAVKRSSAYCGPIALGFTLSLGLLALLASTRADVMANADAGWFAVAEAAGGPLALAIAGLAVFAASMGNIDATVQSMGAQIANDVVAARKPLSERGLMWASQVAIAAITLVSAAIACLPLPALFKIGLFAIQVMTQLSVPLFAGIFGRFGNRQGAVAGMLAGVATVCALQVFWPVGIPWAYGLTTGAIGLLVNAAAFVALGLAIPANEAERARVDALFAEPSLGHAPGGLAPAPVKAG